MSKSAPANRTSTDGFHMSFFFSSFFQNKRMHLSKRTYYKTNKSLLYI